ncbi:MAG: DUF134 domain-containing protein [Lachnospiraceae bacterium]|nr:DUF134 domain-containing protein [Lachnospiraceae bacterium]
MNEMIDIEVIIDERFGDPKVQILTKSRTEQVENIIHAIENVSMTNYVPIAVSHEGKHMIISQRDIYRIRTEGRELIVDTQ